MYTVLIVEDEILVSIGLKSMINWADLDMRVIAEAQNGKLAYEIYQKEKPNLILTDIKMPVMDGLEFISKIRETDSKTKIIILTCYEEFDLLHKALKLGVSDYILKLKMSTDEMESVIRKMHDELINEDVAQVVNNNTQAYARHTKNKFILDYVLCQAYSDLEFEKLKVKMQLKINCSRLVLCVMNIDNYELISNKFDTKHENTIRDTILSLIDELLVKYKRGEIVHEKEGRYILIFSFGDILSEKNTREMFYEILERIGTIMKTYINATVTFGISTFHDNYSSLKDLYVQAVSALEQSYFVGDLKYIQYGEQNNKIRYLSSIKKIKTYVESVENLNGDYRKEILSGLGQLERMYSSPKAEIQEMFIRWIHWSTVNSNAFRDDTSKLSLDYVGRVRGLSKFDETIQVFEQYLLVTVKCQMNSRLFSREVSEAIKYINANYYNDISLQQVAEKVEMSANYLSSLFKKEIHASFVDYVNQTRVNKAKELILHTHLKAYEISQKVGFTDESYFSRIFKRITGLRPNEFKRQNVSHVDNLQETHHV
jgi:two-component system response regulator YesN